MAVINNTYETKGTEVFFIDNVTTTDPTVTKLTCPTGITGVGGGSKDRIDVTCLDNTTEFREYVGGYADPAEVSIPFILYHGDGSHHALFALKAAGTVIPWMVALSDGATVPTLDSDMTALVAPAGRATFQFNAYVSNITLDITTNEVVRGTLTLQPSGNTTPNWS